jgi:chloride channel protein, CIC family
VVAGLGAMTRPGLRRAAFRELAVRSRELVLASALVGTATGLVVAGFDKLTAETIFDAVLRLPVWFQVAAPTLGLVGAFAALRWIGARATTATADAYLHAFHDPSHELGLRAAAGRMVAAVATLGLGGALGYEGPSVYAGATIGQRFGRWLPGLVTAPRRNTLLVAGAAAGVAAIFKAPATGAIFALEVPFQDDLARRSLLPALVGAATGYLTYVALLGTEPLFTVTGRPPFDLRDLGGAIVIGVVCGVGARGFASLLRRSKTLATQLAPAVRIAAGGIVLAACAVVSWWAFDGAPLTLGAGYDALRWSLDPGRSIWLVLLLLVLRAAASAGTLAGGGVGGLFVPLVVEGALVGRLIGGLVGDAGSTLFPVLGVAAFLGAGYRVPLAAIMFVAETTGQPFFVVPGLLAAVTADILAGSSSVTTYQRTDRSTVVARPATRSIGEIVTAGRPVPAHTTVAAYLRDWPSETDAVVVGDENGAPLGVLRRADAERVGPMSATTVDGLIHDAPSAATHWTMADATTAMARAGVDVLAVVNDDGGYVGLVTLDAVLRATGLLSADGSPAPADGTGEQQRRTAVPEDPVRRRSTVGRARRK